MKKGDILRLIDNEGMAAPIGSTACIVEDYDGKKSSYVKIKWIDKGTSGQMDGQYYPGNFEVLKSIPHNKSTMEQAHLAIAKELIELKWNIKVTSIMFEDGSGRKFIITDDSNPIKQRYICL